MKTSELIGPTLDWAVAKCEGAQQDTPFWKYHDYEFKPSTNWAQGGPIIEREKIAISYHPNPSNPGWLPWAASFAVHTCRAETPLIAAMSCFCVGKLGDEVEIPEELK